MPKVICTLENASDEISGVKFTPHPDGGVVSEEISEDQAAAFTSVPGYALVTAAVVTAPVAKPPAAPAKPAKTGGKASAPAPVVPPPAPDADPVVINAGEATATVTTTPPAGDDETTF